METNEKKSREGQGYLQGPDGELSSGRLQKIVSLVVAVISAATGFILMLVNPELANSGLGMYALGITGLFLAVATGSEIAQKAWNH